MGNVANSTTVVNSKVNCNSCRKNIKLKKSMVRKEWVTSEIERSFFTCPYCKKQYTICYEDNEFRENVEKMSKLKDRVNSQIVGSDTYDELLKKYKEYHKRNIEISKSYRAIYDK